MVGVMMGGQDRQYSNLPAMRALLFVSERTNANFILSPHPSRIIGDAARTIVLEVVFVLFW